MFTGPPEDRALIRERYGVYSDAAFRQDMEAWLACWSEEGCWEIFGKEIRGKDALRMQWDETRSALERMAFFSELGAIEVDGNRATAQCYCHEIVVLKGGDLMKVVSQYSDKLVKERGVWLFAHRVYSILIQE